MLVIRFVIVYSPGEGGTWVASSPTDTPVPSPPPPPPSSLVAERSSGTKWGRTGSPTLYILAERNEGWLVPCRGWGEGEGREGGGGAVSLPQVPT